MRGKSAVIVAALAVAVGFYGFSGAAASEEYTRTETLVAETAVPVAEGEVDVEFGMRYSKADAGKRSGFGNNWSRTRRGDVGESYRMYEWMVKATMGVAPDTDISLATGFVDMYDREVGRNPGFSNHGRGMDDLTASVKRRLIADRGLSVAYIAGLTVPTGRHTNIGRGRFGPGQNYWTLDQRLAMTQETEGFTLNTDVGYSLPFGRTRRGWEREYGVHTDWHGEDASERGVLDGNVGLVHAGFVDGMIRPLAEVNYSHRWISRGNDSDLLYATVGGVMDLEMNKRLKVGYHHPVTGRNATRARRVSVSLGYMF